MIIVRNLLNKIYQIDRHSLYGISFGLVYLLWNYTAFTFSGGMAGILGSTLDGSWIIALNWASHIDLPWSGDNLIFTYGPLYYLYGFLLPEFHRFRTILIVHVGMNLVFATCFSYIFSRFSNIYLSTKNGWPLVIVTVLLLAQKPGVYLLSLFVAFISLPIIFPQEVNKNSDLTTNYIRYGILSFILALTPFAKFSHIYESILFMVVLVLFLIYCRKVKDAALLCVLFSAFSVLIWILISKQGILAYLSYLQTRFIISSGYTEAMMMDFSQPSYFQIFILALIYFLILGGVLLYFIFTKRINWVIAWLLPMISLFLGFKSSFVRADGHVYHFLSLIFLSALYFYYLVEFNKTEKMDLPWVQTLAKAFIPFLAVIVYSAYSFLGGKFDVKNDFLGIKELIKSGPTARESYRTLARNRIQEIYDIDPEFLRQIDPAKSIDIIPWDIALLYGYEFKWTPRPVIQSYASYTSKLDLIDAGFFRSVNAPEQLIISLYTIDQRYIIFDTPATFQTLLDTYEYKYHSSDGRYALFVKKPILTLRDTISLSRDQYGFFERIPIPKVSNSHVYLSVEIEPTLSGKIMNFLYKPSEFKVEINLESGEKRVYRFIRDTGKNGLFVSIHVENLNDLAKVFEENYDQNITSISILGDSLFYKEPFNVHFYSVPFFNE